MPDRPAAGLIARAAGLSLLTLACLAPTAAAQSPYSVPPDNPFASTAGAAPEVWIYGMRNPFRWSFDRQTGDVYVGDVGGQREEITFVAAASAPGAKLGWSCFSGRLVQSVSSSRSPAA